VKGRQAGFTLTELAVVLAIVGLLLGSLMYTLSAQTEQRAREETQRRLEEAKELLLAYAVVNGRLPCPATCTNPPACTAGSTGGVESIAAAAGSGTGGTCTVSYNGFLPAVTIGFSPTNGDGFAIDAWGSPIRYAVSSTGAPHFTSNATLKTNGIATAPADIQVCRHLTALNQTTCGAASNRVVTNGTVASVIWSQGKNFPVSGAASIDEANNNDAFAAFVNRTPSPAGSGDGEFDDMVVWIPVGLLYGRMISAGVLP
jgi:prepilin-type N-terminal cleavage/methylation domain-containing protein